MMRTTAVPTNAEDAVAMALDEALTEGGYRRVVFQPYANELVAAAVEALWMDDATLAQAARSAIDRYKDRLLKEAMTCDVFGAAS